MYLYYCNYTNYSEMYYFSQFNYLQIQNELVYIIERMYQLQKWLHMHYLLITASILT